jgi:hypothetical protein
MLTPRSRRGPSPSACWAAAPALAGLAAASIDGRGARVRNDGMCRNEQ